MIKPIRFLLIVCSLYTLMLWSTTAQSSDDNEAQSTAAWQALKAGKAVILMRHALAPGIGDPPGFDLQRCATQRNLSEAGRSQSVAIGDVLRSNGIVEATILSSQWCRCMETAALLDRGEPSPAPMLNSFFEDRGMESERTATLLERLRQWVASSEHWLLSHP